MSNARCNYQVFVFTVYTHYSVSVCIDFEACDNGFCYYSTCRVLNLSACHYEFNKLIKDEGEMRINSDLYLNIIITIIFNLFTCIQLQAC